MSELTEFFYMGGYAAFVWPALIISFLVLLANVLFTRAQYKRVLHSTALRSQARSDAKSTTNN